MADISKCTGEGCKKKETCYRFTAKPCPFLQSYFMEPPIENGECSHYWPTEKPKVSAKPKGRKNGDK